MSQIFTFWTKIQGYHLTRLVWCTRIIFRFFLYVAIFRLLQRWEDIEICWNQLELRFPWSSPFVTRLDQGNCSWSWFQHIRTSTRLRSKCTIATYKKKRNIIRVHHTNRVRWQPWISVHNVQIWDIFICMDMNSLAIRIHIRLFSFLPAYLFSETK